MNPIERLRNSTSGMTPIINISDKKNTYHTRLSTFYEVEKKLVDYDKAIALYGVRRTGKTVVLDQVWEEYGDINGLYLYVARECFIDDIWNIIKESGATLVLIDEITRVSNIDTEIHILLDMCKSYGVKLVLAGTESYLLKLSMKDSALGRLDLVYTTPVLFSDVKKLNNISFREYYTSGILLTKSDIRFDLLENIMNSVGKMYNSNKDILSYLSLEEFGKALEIVVEFIILNNTGRLSNKLVFKHSNYDIESLFVNEMRNLPKASVNILYLVLKSMGIVESVLSYSIDVEDIVERLYLNIPSLYYNVLDKNNIYKITDSKEGVLFEATVITQIIAYARRYGLNRKFFSIRESLGAYEIDLCVTGNSPISEYISLIEFKLSSNKRGKHFFNDSVMDYCRNVIGATDIRRYLVYSKETKDFVDFGISGVQTICIEDFLNDINKYI